MSFQNKYNRQSQPGPSDDKEHTQFNRDGNEYICRTCGQSFPNGKLAAGHVRYNKQQREWRIKHYGH